LCITGFNEVGHRGCRIEIELTAFQASNEALRAAVDWPGVSPFAASAATCAGPLVFYSGMLGIGENGDLVSGSEGLPREAQVIVRPIEERERVRGLAAQCWAALNLLRATAKSAGSSLGDLVKTTVYIANEEDLNVYEAVRTSFLSDAVLPAFECVVVHGPGPVRSAHVQIEAIGVRS
jgi:enamine deaminase RidA (YjgF/YER057c/UK114 family)